jgi:rhodanese-related sulfurtransferase
MDTQNPTIFSLSPTAFNAMLGHASAPLVLDVRRQPRFDESPYLIAGALRCTPEEVERFAHNNPPRTVVVYCVYGHNVSEDAVAQLRSAGWDARALQGGIEGGQDGQDTPANIANWRAAPPLRMTKRPDWGVTGEHASRWVTRERPKIDRIACPWLIRRFIDERAEFFYVPANRVLDEARRLQAVAYDTPAAPVSHQGDLCSFDALLAGFQLQDKALALLATVVRGADTDQLGLAPQSAGLLAFSLGLSRLHAHDDHAMLNAAMPLYDALYAWCKDRVLSVDESHRWNPAPTSTATL